MPVVQAQAASLWGQIGLWIVKALLAAVFLGAGGAKLFGVPTMVEMFEQVGLGQWFRYLTGFLELLGAVTVLIPATAGFGAVLLAVIMVGATLTHLLVLPGSPIPAIVLFVLSILVAWAHRDQITALAGRILVARY
jgi:putative oxidoreductase